jgi:hypothetical protein
VIAEAAPSAPKSMLHDIPKMYGIETRSRHFSIPATVAPCVAIGSPVVPGTDEICVIRIASFFKRLGSKNPLRLLICLHHSLFTFTYDELYVRF